MQKVSLVSLKFYLCLCALHGLRSNLSIVMNLTLLLFRRPKYDDFFGLVLLSSFFLKILLVLEHLISTSSLFQSFIVEGEKEGFESVDLAWEIF